MIESTNILFRKARLQDVHALCLIEKHAFDFNQFSERQFTYLITRANACCVIAEDAKGVTVGYVIGLFRKNSTVCRLYSIALSETSRGGGIAKKLVKYLAAEAVLRQCQTFSLEVRKDNARAIQFYLNTGFLPHRSLNNYYEDGEDALQMRGERTLLEMHLAKA